LLALDTETKKSLTVKLCEGVADCQETMAKVCHLSQLVSVWTFAFRYGVVTGGAVHSKKLLASR